MKESTNNERKNERTNERKKNIRRIREYSYNEYEHNGEKSK